MINIVHSLITGILTDLPSVLILILADKILDDLLCVLINTTDLYVDSIYILLLTFLMNLIEI